MNWQIKYERGDCVVIRKHPDGKHTTVRIEYVHHADGNSVTYVARELDNSDAYPIGQEDIVKRHVEPAVGTRITALQAWSLRRNRGLALPVDAAYESDELRDIAVRQKQLIDELDTLDIRLRSMA